MAQRVGAAISGLSISEPSESVCFTIDQHFFGERNAVKICVCFAFNLQHDGFWYTKSFDHRNLFPWAQSRRRRTSAHGQGSLAGLAVGPLRHLHFGPLISTFKDGDDEGTGGQLVACLMIL